MNKHDRAVTHLASKSWASRLLAELDARGGVRAAPGGTLFELRFAFELSCYHPTIQPNYEFATGVGDSTVDFRLQHAGLEWLIELVALDESDAVRAMQKGTQTKHSPGIDFNAVHLSSDAVDLHCTPWGELVRASEKLASKVWDSRRSLPRKFAERTTGCVHVLLMSMAGFEGIGDPDPYHCREVAFGSGAVPPEQRNLHPKTGEPFLGLFEQDNFRPSAVEFQKRVDLLGFVCEHPAYEDDREIGRTNFLCPNPAVPNSDDLIFKFPVRSHPSERNPLGL